MGEFGFINKRRYKKDKIRPAVFLVRPGGPSRGQKRLRKCRPFVSCPDSFPTPEVAAILYSVLRGNCSVNQCLPII